MFKKISIGLLAVAMVSVIACGKTEQAKDQLISSNSADLVSFYKSYSWPNGEAVPLCWINPEKYSSQISSFKGVIESQYIARTNVRFRFEGKCSREMNSAQVRVMLVDYSSVEALNAGMKKYCGVINIGGCSTKGFYFHQPGEYHGLGINNVKDNFATLAIRALPNKAFERRESNRKIIEESKHIILHELGHSLGFLHENLRDDAVGAENCGDASSTVYSESDEGIDFLTRFDKNSLMSHCNTRTTLSDRDVIGINKLYGSTLFPITDGGDNKAPCEFRNFFDTALNSQKANKSAIMIVGFDSEVKILSENVKKSGGIARLTNSSISCLDKDPTSGRNSPRSMICYGHADLSMGVLTKEFVACTKKNEDLRAITASSSRFIRTVKRLRLEVAGIVNDTWSWLGTPEHVKELGDL